MPSGSLRAKSRSALCEGSVLSRFAGVSEAHAEREPAGEIPKRFMRGIGLEPFCSLGEAESGRQD